AMMRLNSIFCLLFLGLSAPAAADEDIFKIGVEALNRKDYHFAVVCFDDVLRRDANCPVAHYYLGHAYQGKGDNNNAIKNFNDAIKDFGSIIKVNPKNTIAYTGRGNV